MNALQHLCQILNTVYRENFVLVLFSFSELGRMSRELMSLRPCICVNVGMCTWTKILNWVITFLPEEMGLSYLCIACDKTFHVVPSFLTLWPWSWTLTYFWKTFTLVIIFLPEEIGLSYCTCLLLLTLTRPFAWHHKYWSLDLERWPSFEKL